MAFAQHMFVHSYSKNNRKNVDIPAKLRWNNHTGTRLGHGDIVIDHAARHFLLFPPDVRFTAEFLGFQVDIYHVFFWPR